MPTVTESEQLERITQLSSQLSESKHRETELSSGMKDLREQIKELEAVSLWSKMNNCIHIVGLLLIPGSSNTNDEAKDIL